MKKNTKKGLIGLVVMAAFSCAIVFGSAPLYKWIDTVSQTKKEEIPQTGLKDGVYVAENPDFDAKGYKYKVTLTVAGGKVSDLVWDGFNQDGVGKIQLSLEGKYVMTETGLTWAEQSKLLSDYVLKNQSAKGLTLDAEGKIDSIAGVSISVNDFVNLTTEALEKAAGTAATASVLKDGVYVAENPDFDAKGYKYKVTLTVSGGKVSDLIWDGFNQDGVGKIQLSLEGKYVMTETGLTWAEQSKLLSDYVIQNQSAKGLTLDAEGKIDSIAGVSISVNDFVNLTTEALEKAAGESKSDSDLTDGVYTAEKPDFDAKGYKYKVTLTVAGGKIKDLLWDGFDKDGKGKIQMSLDGEYVMTETGLTWGEQSELLAAYVIEKQSLDGLNMNGDGKIDSIAGVSISINEFVELTTEVMEMSGR